MAEHGEIPASWAGLAAAGTFIGGVIAALFGRKKPAPDGAEKTEASVLTERVVKLEQAVILLTEQQRRAELDRDEANAVRGQIFNEIRQTRETVARIEGRLTA